MIKALYLIVSRCHFMFDYIHAIINTVGYKKLMVKPNFDWLIVVMNKYTKKIGGSMINRIVLRF